MIKIFPIILLPSIFIIIFFNVRNLTQSDQNNSSIPISKLNLNQKIDQNVSNPFNEKNGIAKKNELNDANTVLNDPAIINNKDILIEKNIEASESELDKNKKIKNSKIVKEDNLLKKEPARQKDPQSFVQTKSIPIQFGAFTKLENAERHRKFVSKKISKNFSDFDRKLNISRDNKLFKIIYTSDSLEIAKKVCKFSKSLKIGCLILKK